MTSSRTVDRLAFVCRIRRFLRNERIQAVLFINGFENCLRFQAYCTLDCSICFQEGNAEVTSGTGSLSGGIILSFCQRTLPACLGTSILSQTHLFAVFLRLLFSLLDLCQPVMLLDELGTLNSVSEMYALFLKSLWLWFEGAQ